MEPLTSYMEILSCEVDIRLETGSGHLTAFIKVITILSDLSK